MEIEEFNADTVNKTCSIYLYENAKQNNYKNEDVFFLLRFAISGNPVGAPVGDICDIIGSKESIRRLENASEFIKINKYDDGGVSENETELEN